MELWEGAVLLVGGVVLVAYMTRQNAAVQASSSAALAGAVTATPAGTTNASNLTNMTNQAGGYPTIMGEPLTPPQPSISPVPVSVARSMPAPVRGTPVYPVTPSAPVSGPVAMPIGVNNKLMRPVDVHL